MTYDVLVVGGGIAGLSAAAFCAQAGKSVLLCEKSETTGGLINSFTHNGFTFDTGIRAIEDSGIVLPMLKSLGLEVDFIKSYVSLGVGDRVISIQTPEDLLVYGQMLEDLYPGSKADVEPILEDIRMVMKYMDVLYGIENPIFKDLPRDTDFLFKTLFPWLGRFLFTIGKINRMNEPAEAHLRKFTQNRSLIDIISQHFFRRTPAFFAMSYFSLYLDYLYPRGGTGALPAALAKYCEAHGVNIHTKTAVTEIHPEQHLAHAGTDAPISYRQLIWTADQKALYDVVNVDGIQRDALRNRVLARRTLLRDKKGGDSIFAMYLSLDLDPSYFRAISNGHFFYTPSSKGMGSIFHEDLDTLLAGEKDFKAGTLAPSGYREKIQSWLQRYFARTTYEIAIPVLRDDALAPAGKTGIMVSVLMEYEVFRIIRDMGWYEASKTLCENCMIQALTETIYPRLQDSILDRFSYSPLSIERVTGSSQGAITGWAFTNDGIPAISSIVSVTRSVHTVLPDVSQAGQWAYSPSGLPISILTGKLAADRAVKRTGGKA